MLWEIIYVQKSLMLLNFVIAVTEQFKQKLIFKNLDPIALHIRRGDFLKNSGNHHNLGLDYYKQALNQFNPKQQVVIFSDDPQWCLEQELFEGDRFMVSSGNGPYHDLYLMSLCSDFIIANSTFSWWGAWLANRGTVVAPKKWFGPNNQHLSTKDLYPASWKII